MNRMLSHVLQTVRLRSPKPNPTRASPYSSGNRCLNRSPAERISFLSVSHRERSQGRSAMRGREEARQRYSGGRRVGLECRASFPRFGEAWDRGLRRSPAVANTVNHCELLGWVAMSPGANGTLFIPVTIPLRLGATAAFGSTRRVSAAYKVTPKWQRYASLQRTPPRWPLLQGYQQRRSSPAVGPLLVQHQGESLNLSEQGSLVVFKGIVSPALNATKWPDRAPSRSTLLVAKKHSQIPRPRFPCGCQS